jgi:hypothetical protein
LEPFGLVDCYCAKAIGHQDATEVEQVPQRFVVRLGQGLAITAAISIALSVIGYSDLAVALLRAVLLSAGLLGILVVTFDAVRNTSAMLSTDPSAGHDSLAAVVVNASLMVASLPVFALILGGAQIRADGAVVDL